MAWLGGGGRSSQGSVSGCPPGASSVVVLVSSVGGADVPSAGVLPLGAGWGLCHGRVAAWFSAGLWGRPVTLFGGWEPAWCVPSATYPTSWGKGASPHMFVSFNYHSAMPQGQACCPLVSSLLLCPFLCANHLPPSPCLGAAWCTAFSMLRLRSTHPACTHRLLWWFVCFASLLPHLSPSLKSLCQYGCDHSLSLWVGVSFFAGYSDKFRVVKP